MINAYIHLPSLQESSRPMTSPAVRLRASVGLSHPSRLCQPTAVASPSPTHSAHPPYSVHAPPAKSDETNGISSIYSANLMSQWSK